jgi:hypothetical protein
MIRGFSRRGQPLTVLILLLGSWVSARAMLWDASTLELDNQAISVSQVEQELVATVTQKLPQPGAFTRSPISIAALDRRIKPPVPTLPKPAIPLNFQPASALPAPLSALPMPIQFSLPRRSDHLSSPSRNITPPVRLNGMAGGHQMLWMAALARLPMLESLSRLQPSSAMSLPPMSEGGETILSTNRWSVDSWVFWRRGGQAQLAGSLLSPTYGASQAGAVLRYRLMPENRQRPTAYLRTTAALNGSGEREAALGLSARPFASIPLVASGEARFTSTPDGYIVRPAAFLVTELAPFILPYGLRGEAYGQAGYVGGQYATAFADAQVRIDRSVMRVGKGDLRFGGGVWAGAQKGASRLDAGPSLTFGHTIGGKGGVRLGADWRFRVAGNAAPASGPAITLSAGF